MPFFSRHIQGPCGRGYVVSHYGPTCTTKYHIIPMVPCISPWGRRNPIPQWNQTNLQHNHTDCTVLRTHIQFKRWASFSPSELSLVHKHISFFHSTSQTQGTQDNIFTHGCGGSIKKKKMTEWVSDCEVSWILIIFRSIKSQSNRTGWKDLGFGSPAFKSNIRLQLALLIHLPKPS